MMDQQIELMRRFIVQEANACESADPELVTVFGWDLVDWMIHPKPTFILGVYIACLEDGSKVTVLVCKPVLAYEPTTVQFWKGDKLSEHRAAYFCPNALLVVRPTEEGDETLIEPPKKEATWKS